MCRSTATARQVAAAENILVLQLPLQFHVAQGLGEEGPCLCHALDLVAGLAVACCGWRARRAAVYEEE